MYLPLQVVKGHIIVSGQQAQVLFYPDTHCGQAAFVVLEAWALRVQSPGLRLAEPEAHRSTL